MCSILLGFVAESNGLQIYFNCIAFKYPVSEDIVKAYHVNSSTDKCIWLVSYTLVFVFFEMLLLIHLAFGLVEVGEFCVV